MRLRCEEMGLIRSDNTRLAPEDDDELTGYLLPIALEMVKTAVENGQNLIVEGCCIPPDWRRDFGGRLPLVHRLSALTSRGQAEGRD